MTVVLCRSVINLARVPKARKGWLNRGAPEFFLFLFFLFIESSRDFTLSLYFFSFAIQLLNFKKKKWVLQSWTQFHILRSVLKISHDKHSFERQSNELFPVTFKSIMFIIFAQNLLVNPKIRSLNTVLILKYWEKNTKSVKYVRKPKRMNDRNIFS